MRCLIRIGLFCLSTCFLLSIAVWAGGRNVADYPLRVHVFEVNTHSHYTHQSLDEVDGEGRANLFERGEPRGVDFGYRCSERIRSSMGFETYPARWKKPGKELEILVPVFGKPGASNACGLEVTMKTVAYVKHNGALSEEPVAAFKEWMKKYQYDPEHGKDQPVKPQSPVGAKSPK